MSPPVVVARGLGYGFGAQQVIDDVDLDLHAGEVFGFVGPNGGGKSTLLRLLAGLSTPTAGTVTIGGDPAHSLAVRREGRVGLITAEPGVYPLLTGRENLAFFGGLYGLSPAEVDARTGPLLASLGLVDALDRPTATMSSGMRQKVSLARALLLEPRVLLLDEPTSHLDPTSSATMHQAIRAQADRGVAVGLVTHDLHAAEQICDRVGAFRTRLWRVDDVGPGRVPARSRLADLFELAAQDRRGRTAGSGSIT